MFHIYITDFGFGDCATPIQLIMRLSRKITVFRDESHDAYWLDSKVLPLL
jgi:hypothetical protein